MDTLLATAIRAFRVRPNIHQQRGMYLRGVDNDIIPFSYEPDETH